jgi:hypothetical protein
MTTEQIAIHKNRQPFRSFIISLTNGESLFIKEFKDLHISPYKPNLITVFTEDGLVHLIEADSVVKIASP